MSDNKKYYYMRLKEGFFDSEEIKLLEAMPDGYLYSNILLKLYLISLKHEGRLMFNNAIPYNAQMIATITKHQIGTVEKALDIYQSMGLIEILDNGAIYMMHIQELIGESSSEADRKREYRARIEAEKKTLIVGTNVPTEVRQKSDISPPEIEIKTETKIEINSDVRDIVDYLNQKTGKGYKPTSRKTQELIKARLKEGFSVDDFKTVIEKKSAEWLNDAHMNQYLRPETLFGTKFEGYLNQTTVKPKAETTQFKNFKERTYDFASLEAELLKR